MVSFRRWITVLAVLSLFTGLGLAQVQVGSVSNTGAGPLQCTASVAVPPTLRAEGMTDLIGDIVLTCTGGITPAVGTQLSTVNISVSLGTNVTSRLLGSNFGSTSGNNPSNTSEAMLLIDEPTAVSSSSAALLAAGVGGNAPVKECMAPGTGSSTSACADYAVSTACNGPACNGVPAITVASSSSTTPQTTPVGPYNAFFGLVSGNQVTFQGIPVLPPATTGLARVFRITNVRANISGLSAGLAGTTPLTASVAISGSTSVPVNNPVLTAGFIQAGLSTALRNKNNDGGLTTSKQTFAQCNSQPGSGSTPVALGVLEFTKNFGTAFKVRVQPGQIPSIPGVIYNSESGFVDPNVNVSSLSSTMYPGLADYGTRLKAVFNNVPSGVRLFVSTTNTAGNTSDSNVLANSTPYAALVSNTVGAEMMADSGQTNTPPIVAATTSENKGNTAIAELPVINNTAEAVWEVLGTNPAALENFNFALYIVYKANPANNSPAVGTGTVSLSYAPTPTQGAFTTAAGTAASATLGIPRFADTSTASNFLTIAICQTDLLFPFVTNQAGFDTGIAIANTTTDPFSGTTGGSASAQAGDCTLNWYQGKNNPAATDTGSIASGTVYTTLASTAAPGFQGYMIAVCNFQYAHGFAFISDLGARNLAMGYLALVVGDNEEGAASRGATAAEWNGN